MNTSFSEIPGARATTGNDDAGVDVPQPPEPFLTALATDAATAACLVRGNAGADQGLSARDRTRVAIVAAEYYRCDALLSYHFAQGRSLGLNGAEMDANRAGFSHEAKANEMVGFCTTMLAAPEHVGDEHFMRLDWAGYRDTDVEEMVFLLIVHAMYCSFARGSYAY